MHDLTNWLPVLNLGLILLLALAGAFAFNRQRQRDISEIQDRVITALREENQTLSDRVEGLQRQHAQLEGTIATIRVALKRRGITMHINGEFVTFEDTGVATTTTVRIRKETVQHMASGDDDD